MSLAIGDLAPNFTLPSEKGEKITLTHLKGKKVLLYFYPKDMTPGCTQQACDFRDLHAQYQKKNIEIFGISKDSAKTHGKFKQKYELPFTLLVDTDAAVCELYGVVNPKSLFGKTFLGIERSTFLIDENGFIQQIWRKVKVANHAEKVLNESN